MPDRGERWDTEAACAELATLMPETFDAYFYNEEADRGPARMAMRICGVCPVRIECLEDALAHHDGFGIKGGKTPEQRRQMIRERKLRIV